MVVVVDVGDFVAGFGDGVFGDLFWYFAVAWDPVVVVDVFVVVDGVCSVLVVGSVAGVVVVVVIDDWVDGVVFGGGVSAGFGGVVVWVVYSGHLDAVFFACGGAGLVGAEAASAGVCFGDLVACVFEVAG